MHDDGMDKRWLLEETNMASYDIIPVINDSLFFQHARLPIYIASSPL